MPEMTRQQCKDWLVSLNALAGRRVIEPTDIVVSSVLPLINSGYVVPSLPPDMGVWLAPTEVRMVQEFIAGAVGLGYAPMPSEDDLPPNVRHLLRVGETRTVGDPR